jgi:hypothetical protein
MSLHMLVRSIFAILCVFTLPHPATAQNVNAGVQGQAIIQTIVVDGVGLDIQDAAQDAAKNALTNLVGSLMNTEDLLNNRSQITDGIRTQTKGIKSTIREYSQGHIQFFEILETRKEAGLFRVTARVSVRIEDFRAYVKKLAQGEAVIDGGLFTQVQSERNQKDNKIGLVNDLLKPLIDGEVIRFRVEKPIRLSDSNYRGGQYAIDRIVQQHGSENIFFIKVNASIDLDFLANMKRVIANTSSGHTSTPHNGRRDARCDSFMKSFNPLQDVPFAFFSAGMKATMHEPTIPNTFADIFVLKNVRGGVIKLPNPGQSTTSLEVAIVGNNGQELQRERIGAQKTSRVELLPDDRAGDRTMPWSLIGWSLVCDASGSYSIFEKRSFTLVLAIDPNSLRQANKVIIRMIK